MDTIFIRDLRIDTIVGINDWERRMRQTVALDIDLAADCRRAAATDSVEDTLDYKALAKRVIGFVQASEFKLVETLAEGVADVIRSEFDVPWVRVRLNKPGALRNARDVGVDIERGSRES